MPYGYIGQNTPNQTVSNSGVFSISDVASLEKQGKFGGSLELIAEQSYSSDVSTIDFTSIDENIYNVHLMVVSGVKGSVSTVSQGIRFYESGVLETASVYQYARQYNGVDGIFVEQRGTTRPYIPIMGRTLTTSVGNGNAYIYFYNLGDSSKYSFVTFQDNTMDVDRGGLMMFGGGVLPQTSTVDGINWTIDSGNFTGFNIKLYGVKQL